MSGPSKPLISRLHDLGLHPIISGVVAELVREPDGRVHAPELELNALADALTSIGEDDSLAHAVLSIHALASLLRAEHKATALASRLLEIAAGVTDVLAIVVDRLDARPNASIDRAKQRLLQLDTLLGNGERILRAPNVADRRAPAGAVQLKQLFRPARLAR